MKTTREFVDELGLALKPFPEHISVSQINSYNQCHLQWFLKYGTTAIPRYPSRMLIGTLVHKGLETANNLVYHGMSIDDAAKSTVEDVINAAIDKIDEDAYVWDDNPSSTYSKVLKVANRAVNVIKELPRPMLVEHPIAGLNLGSTPIEGYIDVFGEDGFVRDFKVGARHKSQAECDKDIQLSLYAWAMSTPKVSYVSISSATGEYKIIESIREPKTIEQHMGAMEMTCENIVDRCCIWDGETTGDITIESFPPNLDSKYGCSGCSFYHLCPYGGGC